jgi:hypothetical protein
MTQAAAHRRIRLWASGSRKRSFERRSAGHEFFLEPRA